MAVINKPAQPLIAPTDLEDVEAIAGAAAADAIAADTTHAPLVNDLVPAANLPSYVDDVLEFATLDSFPAEGEAGKIYVALDTNNTYRWADTTYVQVGGSEIDLTPYALKTEVAAKADAATVVALADTVAAKADASKLETLAGVVAVKADSSTVVALADTVATKADVSAVAAKADSATVAALAEEVAAKANAAAIQQALAEMEDEIAAKAGSAAIEELEGEIAAKANSDAVTLALSTKASAADVAELQRVTHNLEAVAFDGCARQYVDAETGSWRLTDLPTTPGIYRINSDLWTGVYGVLLWNDSGWTCWLNWPGYEFFHGELPEPGVTEIILDEIDPTYYDKDTVDELLASKQDVINDLDTIRSNAVAGAEKIGFDGEFHAETDAETGDSWILLGESLPETGVYKISGTPTGQGVFIVPDLTDDPPRQWYLFITGNGIDNNNLAIFSGTVEDIEERGSGYYCIDLSNSSLRWHDEDKQDALVSGTNIKSINNQSVLGEGNLEIQAGMDEQAVAELIDNIAIEGNINKVPETGHILKGYETAKQTFANLDVELINRFIEEGEAECVDTYGRHYYFDALSENDLDVYVSTPELEACGFLLDYSFTVRLETDPESGDTQVIIGEQENRNPDAFDALENFGFPKAHNILTNWAPKDNWDGSLQMLLEQQDAELVDKVIAAGMHEDAETGDYFCRPIHFVDALGNKYTVEPIEWTSADFYIEWNYEHGIDSIDTDQGISPVQKWQCQIESDAETGVPTRVVWTKDYETRYATIEDIGVSPEAVAEIMSEMEATDADIDAIFGIEPVPSEHGGE